VCWLDLNMSGEVSTPEQIIARIAASQHGHVTRSQLLNAGFDGNAIDYRVKKGRLVLRYRGVYAVGHIPPSPHARAMAAVLACGPGAALSHRSAAALWGLTRWPSTLEVTATTDRRVPGVRTHRSRNLIDVTAHYGIPTTTPARTLLDLAGILDPASLTRALNDARLRNLLSLDDLDDVLARSPGRATRALADDQPEAPTRSVFEDTFLAFLDRHHLPRPEVNQRVAGYEVDMLWRPQRLVAELDGRAYHRDFERDRERDADLLAAGLRVVRVTWQRLTRAEAREAARFASLLSDCRTTRG
jgi:very-short-patch-repair endonuclease